VLATTDNVYSHVLVFQFTVHLCNAVQLSLLNTLSIFSVHCLCDYGKLLCKEEANSVVVPMLNMPSSMFIQKYYPTTAPIPKPSLRLLSVQDGGVSNIFVKLVHSVGVEKIGKYHRLAILLIPAIPDYDSCCTVISVMIQVNTVPIRLNYSFVSTCCYFI